MTDLLYKAGRQWGHDDLLHDLARHASGKSNRMIWVDQPLGPAGSVRPDLFSMAKSYTKPLPLSYEVKVSLADFRRDVTAGKWQSYLEFSAGVIFSAPVGMIERADLPAACGLMVRSEKGWRTIRAPSLQSVDIPVAVLQKLLIDGMTRSRAETRSLRRADWDARQSGLKAIGRRFGEAAARYVENADRAERRLKDIGELEDLEHRRAAIAQIQDLSAELREVLGVDAGADTFVLRIALENALKMLRGQNEWPALRRDLESMAHSFERLRGHPLLKPDDLFPRKATNGGAEKIEERA